jgi:hypothetical protein
MTANVTLSKFQMANSFMYYIVQSKSGFHGHHHLLPIITMAEVRRIQLWLDNPAHESLPSVPRLTAAQRGRLKSFLDSLSVLRRMTVEELRRYSPELKGARFENCDEEDAKGGAEVLVAHAVLYFQKTEVPFELDITPSEVHRHWEGLAGFAPRAALFNLLDKIDIDLPEGAIRELANQAKKHTQWTFSRTAHPGGPLGAFSHLDPEEIIRRLKKLEEIRAEYPGIFFDEEEEARENAQSRAA